LGDFSTKRDLVPPSGYPSLTSYEKELLRGGVAHEATYSFLEDVLVTVAQDVPEDDVVASVDLRVADGDVLDGGTAHVQ
jgi:hypothetical protein